METHQEKPIVVRAALAGIAANNIFGNTLHSLLRLNFGNVYTALDPGTIDSLRHTYADLQVLIIDEISMIKPDLLFQVSSKLLFDIIKTFSQCVLFTDSSEAGGNQAESTILWWCGCPHCW